MDADAPITNGADADGKVVWAWHPNAGVKFVKGNFHGRRWLTSPVRRGRHEIIRKPLRGECRVIPV